MTEFLILASMSLAGFFLVDPIAGGSLTKAGPAKALVLVAVYGSLFLHLVGRLYADPLRFRRVTADIVRAWWPIMLLSLAIVLGSLYARLIGDIRETFLAVGLGMSFLPLFALAAQTSASPFGFIRRLLLVYLGTVAAMLVVLLADLHTFHEEIFLAVPLGFYLLADPRPKVWRIALGLGLIGATLVSFKNTTFLLVLACLFAFGLMKFMRGLQHDNRIARLLFAFLGSIFAMATIAAVVVAWLYVRDHLPSGNTEYRLETYRIAWERFLESPVWGTGFTDSAVIFFRLYRVGVATNDLPTHSDILDLLAHGGLLALALWLMTIAKLVRMTWIAMRQLSAVRHVRFERVWRMIWVFGLVQICAVITYAFNPPLLSPNHGLWIWGSLGLMWVLFRRLEQELPKPVPGRFAVTQFA
jgi:O-antigen ligase